MSQTRRELLLRALLGGGAVGLRALATGLPAALLSRSGWAEAAAPEVAAEAGSGEATAAQFLILSTSSAGDPVNANTPGTYDHPAIQHSADPRMQATPLRLGKKRVVAAAPWASLPQPVLDRTLFFHHSTLLQSHPGHPQVLELLGAAGESAPALYSRHLARRLGTAQSEPLLVGAAERVMAGGRPLPRLGCLALRDALTTGPTPLARLVELREQSLDALHRQLSGRAARARRALLDRHAQSPAQARDLGERLLTDLSAIRDDGVDAQVAAAAALIRLGAAPVVVISIPFGGDNHFDYEFRAESEQTVTGVTHLARLLDKLKAYGLQDRTTFALLNVFGRTLQRHGRVGRDHWAGHHTAILIGKPFAGGVIGGLEPRDGDFAATAICAATGEAAAPGARDAVPAAETLPALGKTLGRGLGVAAAPLEAAFPAGQVIRAALA